MMMMHHFALKSFLYFLNIKSAFFFPDFVLLPGGIFIIVKYDAQKVLGWLYPTVCYCRHCRCPNCCRLTYSIPLPLLLPPPPLTITAAAAIITTIVVV